MRQLRGLRVLVTGVVTLVGILSLAPVGASSANISHSYHSTDSITNGSLVSLDTAKSDYVEPANTDNASQLFGVAVARNDSLLAVDPSSGTVQIATTGEASVLVSTLNGPIRVGDMVGISPFNGVGEKALPGSHVIGLAQTAFDSSTSGAQSQTVTDKNGKSSTIQVGLIRASIAVTTNAVNSGGPQLNSLQKLGKSLTGHTVSTARVILSIAIAVVASLSLIVLIYASIFGSIISIGRNPLAKYAVFRTLGSVLAMAGVTALIAGFTVFLLLH